ncbi:MAG: hypothetical protein U0521_22690 [Anaerolineae bacterium]
MDGKILSSDALEIRSQLTGRSSTVIKNVGDPVYSSRSASPRRVMQATTVSGQALNQLSDLASSTKRVLTPTQQRIGYIDRSFRS